jgi:excisionase family DNA binding protein
MEEEKLYTPEEVSKFLKVSSRTVYSYIKDKKLKAVRVGTRYWRVKRSDLQEFLQED